MLSRKSVFSDFRQSRKAHEKSNQTNNNITRADALGSLSKEREMSRDLDVTIAWHTTNQV